MNTFPEEKRDQLLEMRAIPYEAEVGRGGSHRLIFVSHDPARPDVQRLIQELKVGRVEIRYAPESDIASTIAELFPRQNEYLQRMTDDPFAVDLGTNFDAKDDLIDEEALKAEISRSTLINLFEAALVEAVRQGASDVHVYPNPHKMGIEPFLISYAINLVVAQRLIRNVCPTCRKKDDEPDRVLLKSRGFTDTEIDETTFFKASYDKSCRTCKGIGYKGRRALCETLYFSSAIRHLIVEAGEAIDEDEIRTQPVKEGMLTL